MRPTPAHIPDEMLVHACAVLGIEQAPDQLSPAMRAVVQAFARPRTGVKSHHRYPAPTQSRPRTLPVRSVGVDNKTRSTGEKDED